MLGLVEHYYGIPLNQDDFEADYWRAENCVQRLYDTAIYRALTNGGSVQLLEAEQLRSFDLSNLKVWLKIDMAVQPVKNLIEIVDWKTGENSSGEGAELQFAVYALYAMRRWSTSAGQIATREVRLGNGQELRHRIGDQQLSQAKDHMERSAGQMQALLVDPIRNIARKEDFAPTADLSRCRACNFRGACEREGIQRGLPATVAPTVKEDGKGELR
jgi:hypothetical protein